MLYTEFQSPTMPGTFQKVCVGVVGGVGWVVVCKPISVFSFGQAEQKCPISAKNGKFSALTKQNNFSSLDQIETFSMEK